MLGGNATNPVLKNVQMIAPMAVLYLCQMYKVEEMGLLNHLRALYLSMNLLALLVLLYIYTQIQRNVGAKEYVEACKERAKDAELLTSVTNNVSSTAGKPGKKNEKSKKSDKKDEKSDNKKDDDKPKTDDLGRPMVTIPAVVVMGNEQTPERTVTVQEYDSIQLKEEVRKILMGAGILCLIHFKWDVLMPLILQSVMIPLSMIGSQLFEVYCLGQYEKVRPFPAPAGPFGDLKEQWEKAQNDIKAAKAQYDEAEKENWSKVEEEEKKTK